MGVPLAAREWRVDLTLVTNTPFVLSIFSYICVRACRPVYPYFVQILMMLADDRAHIEQPPFLED